MTTLKPVEAIDRAIQRLNDTLEINREFMDADDIGDLQATIEGLKQMSIIEKHKAYKKQLKDFIDYLNTGGHSGDDDEKFQQWCDTDYVILHGDQRLDLCSTADVVSDLTCLLEDHLTRDVG